MTDDPNATRDFAGQDALRTSARQSLARALGRPVYLALVAAAGAGGLAAGLAGQMSLASLWIIAPMVVTGGLVGLIAVQLLARSVADLAVQPVGFLLAQSDMHRALDEEVFHWRRGRALGRTEIRQDLAALDLQLRRLTRRSREALLELETAREEAKQQNLAQSHFLAKMSHELRTPLNAILGYTMLLQEDAAANRNVSALADLERIDLAGRNLLGVINDILDHARIEAGKTNLDRGVIDIRELAAAAAGACPPEQRNGNSFELAVADAVTIMVGDSGKVRQCLLNLLSNAFKFTSNGKVSLIIAPSRCANGPGVSFTVRDTGIGIKAADLPRMFDAFSQMDDTARRFGGSGLGLAITRRLAKMMGGDCTVQSIEGQGSSFCLTLPSSLSGGSASGRAAVPFSHHPLPARTSERSVLIVDDDEAAIDLMRRWVERFGYDVFAAPDGESCLAMAREHRPDLILLDALLPGISGYDVLAELRADEALKETPVILVTVDDDRPRGVQAGASEYLRKPIREAQIRSILDLYSGKAKGEVLIVDDDDDSAELIKRCVEQIGFSSRRASNGLEGLEMASQAPPAAIVLDLAMPGLDGLGVIERLRAEERLKAIPLIVVSGCEVSLREHEALATAGYRFFAKGYSTPREIAQSLQELVA